MVATTDTFRAALAADKQETSYRVEAVTATGQSLGPVPVNGARVDFDGDQGVAWSATFTLSDPAMVPQTSQDWLDGRSGTRLRVWWRLLTAAGWEEVPIGTFAVEDPTVRDSGLLDISVPGLDPLSIAKRGGYGATVVPVGGMTTGDALARLFATAAPSLPVSIEPSSTHLPLSYDLWDRDPAQDWTDIAGMAGQVVRTNRLGVIAAARPSQSDLPVADWQEGEGCPVIDIKVTTRTSTIPRRVVVVSSSPDVSPPVSGIWVNPNSDSQSLTYEMRIQSPTVTTVEACESMARMSGERWSRPVQYVELTVPQRGDLSYGDVVLLSRAQTNLAGPFRVAGWTMVLRGPADPPEPMTVRLMPRQWL